MVLVQERCHFGCTSNVSLLVFYIEAKECWDFCSPNYVKSFLPYQCYQGTSLWHSGTSYYNPHNYSLGWRQQFSSHIKKEHSQYCFEAWSYKMDSMPVFVWQIIVFYFLLGHNVSFKCLAIAFAINGGDGIADLFVLARFTACEHKRVWK